MARDSELLVRPVRRGDAAAIQAIYAHYVRETAVSFDVEPPEVAELEARIEAYTRTYPWLVAERNGELVAYAYGSPHRARPSYLWSADVSIYVRPGLGRLGIGRKLYEPLLARLEASGFASLFAGITLPNAGSVGLHEAMGFTPIGVYRRVGFKHGAWHDVGWWQRQLAQPCAPEPPGVRRAGI